MASPRLSIEHRAVRTVLAVLVLGAVAAPSAHASTPPGGSAPPDGSTAPDASAPPGGGALVMPTAPAPTMPPPDTSGDQTPPTGANGIAIDADGDLWIADGLGDQILEVDAATGEILSRWPTSEALFPDDLVLDEEGRLYYTGILFGLVGRIDPSTGEHVVIATLPAGANPITWGTDGELLVGIAEISGDALYRVDPAGTTDPELLAVDLGGVNAFDVADDGYLYAPRLQAGELIRIDPADGSVLDVVADGFGLAGAVKVADDGTIVVLQAAPSPTLWGVTLPAGGGEAVVEQIAAVPSDVADNFAIADDGAYYVTGFNKPLVFAIAPDGTAAEIEIGTPAG